MSKFLPTKWRDPKKFSSNKYSRNSSMSCVLDVDLEYILKNYVNYINDYPVSPDKVKI